MFIYINFCYDLCFRCWVSSLLGGVVIVGKIFKKIKGYDVIE